MTVTQIDTAKRRAELIIQLHILVEKGSKGLYIEQVSTYGINKGARWDGESTQSNFSQQNEMLLMKGGSLDLQDYRMENNQLHINCKLIQS